MLILASQSPRRAVLLTQLGVQFQPRPAHIDERPHPGENPLDYVRRMAREKALTIFQSGGPPVLAADTTVVLDGESLGKPADAPAARRMLQRLSGRSHQVRTAVCLAHARGSDACDVCTEVSFCELTPALIDAYLATAEPWDKAGAYGIQGLAGALVRRIEGSYSNVVGLPLAETRELLQAAGIATALDGPVS